MLMFNIVKDSLKKTWMDIFKAIMGAHFVYKQLDFGNAFVSRFIISKINVFQQDDLNTVLCVIKCFAES